MNSIKLILGDCLEQIKTLPSDSVHACISSPPYFQQRDYGVDGQIGLEESVEEFIDKLVELYREVKRVLHPSGTIWVNLGDGYAAGGKGGGGSFMDMRKEGTWADKATKKGWRTTPGLKPKDLIGAPWRLALALQADGWYLRSDIIWHKPSAMPESVTDRPGKAHEYVFLLSKEPHYFYDGDAIREKTGNEMTPEEYEAAKVGSFHNHENDLNEGLSQKKTAGFKVMTHPLGRNRRTVWSIPTEAFKDSHFATFPTKLVEPCIKAATSEKGCCPTCFSPWIRIHEEGIAIKENHRNGFRGENDNTDRPYLHSNKDNSKPKPRKRADAPGAKVSPTSVFRTGEIKVKLPIDWKPSCDCEKAEPIPCTILDPFSGAGTTGLVAARNQRSYIGIELNPEYLEMSRERIYKDQPLFNQIEVVNV